VKDTGVQRYHCKNCGCTWYHKRQFGKLSVKTVIKIVFTYLRCLSYNRLREIVYSWINHLISKQQLIRFLEYIADRLPPLEKITDFYQPKRSGYVGLDGLWMKYRGTSFVILIAFDVEVLDIIGYQVAWSENEESWLKLFNKCSKCFQSPKGFYIDGMHDLVRAVKNNFPNIPIQLCVFHKEIRIGQIIPLVRLKTEEEKWLKEVFEIVLYSESEVTALRYFFKLKLIKTIDPTDKKKKIFGVLNRNFNLLMTHHSYPDMHRTNNVLEGFNGNISQKLDVMRGIKKFSNIDRYLKLILLDYRFRKIRNSKDKCRNNKSPLELAGCEDVPTFQHWIEKHLSK